MSPSVNPGSKSLFGQANMSHYSVARGRGRKKEVERFTPKQGLCVLALLMLSMRVILLLMVFGVLHVEVD
jgi:hypothetical protein